MPKEPDSPPPSHLPARVGDASPLPNAVLAGCSRDAARQVERGNRGVAGPRQVVSEELGPPIELALAYARAGEEERADSLTQELEAEIPEREGAQYWWDHLRLAQLSMLRGEKRQAIEHLERAYELGYRDAHIRNDRLMEPLRDDPRFRRFVARMDEDIDRMRAAAIRRQAD